MQIYSGQVDGIILWFLWRLTDSHFQNVKQEKVNSMEKKKEESATAAKIPVLSVEAEMAASHKPPQYYASSL